MTSWILLFSIFYADIEGNDITVFFSEKNWTSELGDTYIILYHF